MADVQIDADVREVLGRAECVGVALRLPPGQLNPALYKRVDKALRNVGGKWSKSAQAHIFASDAQPKLTAMLGVGVSVDEKKRDQSFFTPPDLARKVVALADVCGRVVLEPSAGMGALADACMAANADYVECVEINPEYVAALDKKGHPVTHHDFLTLFKITQYERVVMNPPFTKNQDIKHVNCALEWLKPNGILVAIVLNNQTRKGFKEIVAKYDPEIIEVERGAFKESGTMIPTIIVKIQPTGDGVAH